MKRNEKCVERLTHSEFDANVDLPIEEETRIFGDISEGEIVCKSVISAGREGKTGSGCAVESVSFVFDSEDVIQLDRC